MILFLYQYGPAVVSLLLALILWYLTRRTRETLSTPARILTALGVLVALGCTIAFDAWSVFPFWMPRLDEDGILVLQLVRYMLPLLLTAVALLFLIWPVRPVGPRGAAELAPRTLTTFVSTPGRVSLSVAVVAVVVVTVIAGLASTPDDAGRYLMYGLEASDSTRSSTTIYGWWFSVPCLALGAVIIAVVLIELAVISRPQLAADRNLDVGIRKARVGHVLMVSTGGLLLHLGAVFQSLYGTSAMRLGLDAGRAGFVELGTSFAAIGPALLIASYLVTISGLILWWRVLFSTIPTRSRQPAEHVSA